MTNEEKIKELVNKCPLYQDCKEGYGLHQEAISNALQEYVDWVRQQTLEEVMNHKFNTFEAKTSLIEGNVILSEVKK